MARAIDPVCGMAVDTKTAAAAVKHESGAYHFCSDQCAATFRADPGRFLPGETPERHEPPFTHHRGITAPKFGAAGSGGAEYEPIPEQHERE